MNNSDSNLNPNTVNRDPNGNYHEQLDENFRKLQDATKDVIHYQECVALSFTAPEFTRVKEKQDKNLSLLKDALQYSEDKSDQDKGKVIFDPETDKKILANDNAIIKEQSACIRDADNLLRDNPSKPFENETVKVWFDEINESLEKREQLLKEREKLTELREWQLEETIKENRLEEQEAPQEQVPQEEGSQEEASQGEAPQQQVPQQQGGNKKRKYESIVDEYADVSQEPTDYTGGDD